jgi:hypothetical protein
VAGDRWQAGSELVVLWVIREENNGLGFKEGIR